MHAKIVTQVTLTSESVIRFLKSAFKFQKVFITPIPVQLYLLYLAHTCIRTRPFHAHQNLTPSDLDLTSESVLGLEICI